MLSLCFGCLELYVKISIILISFNTNDNSVFCPGFQKGRVPSEKDTFSAVNRPSKGYN